VTLLVTESIKMSARAGVEAAEAEALEKVVSKKSELDDQLAFTTDIATIDKDTVDPEELRPDQIPTEEDLHTLRRVADKFPLSAWLVAIVEFAERCSLTRNLISYACSDLVALPVPTSLLLWK
jgi:hypothetical protein